jgi:hypothetical protein
MLQQRFCDIIIHTIHHTEALFQPKRCPGPLLRHESGRGPLDAPVVLPVEAPVPALRGGAAAPALEVHLLTALTAVVSTGGVGIRLLPLPPNCGQIRERKSYR